MVLHGSVPSTIRNKSEMALVHFNGPIYPSVNFLVDSGEVNQYS